MKNFMYILALTACLSLNIAAEDTSLDDNEITVTDEEACDVSEGDEGDED